MRRLEEWGSTLAVIMLTMMLVCSTETGPMTVTPSIYGTGAHFSSQTNQGNNYVQNPGFESGQFAPWVDSGSTGYNSITTDRAYSGSYATFLDTHVSSAPYEPVYQELAAQPTLDEDPHVIAAIFPAEVGETCGQAGVAIVQVEILDEIADVSTNILYEWSGYTFPGHDLGANTSSAVYLLFDWTPDSWNTLDRALLSDYSAVFGPPADPSYLRVTRVSLLAHSSNGDPGDFYADDIFIGRTPEASTTSTDSSTTSSATESSTTPPSTDPTMLFRYISQFVTGISLAVIVIVSGAYFKDRGHRGLYSGNY